MLIKYKGDCMFGITGFLIIFVLTIFIVSVILLINGIKNKNKKIIIISSCLFVSIFILLYIFICFVTSM